MANKPKKIEKKKTMGKRPYPKTKNPPVYSYTLSCLKKEKYVQFNGDKDYPLYILEMILKDCKKSKIDEKTNAYGFLIAIPKSLSPFPLASKKNTLTHSKKLSRGSSGEKRRKNAK